MIFYNVYDKEPISIIKGPEEITSSTGTFSEVVIDSGVIRQTKGAIFNWVTSKIVIMDDGTLSEAEDTNNPSHIFLPSDYKSIIRRESPSLISTATDNPYASIGASLNDYHTFALASEKDSRLLITGDYDLALPAFLEGQSFIFTQYVSKGEFLAKIGRLKKELNK